MLDRKDLEKHLQGVSPKLCVAFAVRCSLRVLPILVMNKSNQPFWYWEAKDRPKNLLAILAAQQASVNVSAFGRDFNREIAVVSDATEIATSAAASAAFTTTYTAIAADFVIASDSMGVAMTAASAAISAESAANAAAANAAATATTANYNLDINKSILSDLNRIIATGDAALGLLNQSKSDLLPLDFLCTPLWVSSPPKDWVLLQQRFNKAAYQLNSGFEIWLDWYQDRVDGRPLDQSLEEKWLDIPEEIKAQGVGANNAYLASLLSKESERPLNLVRGIFIGTGDAGKTSLIRALHNEEVIEGKEKMTPGIAIREWHVPDTEIKARFWDFGGQVMSHSTHQFFLRERCLYILVLDARSEFNANDQAEYWLEHVKAFGKNAGVMLVGNKSDLAEVNLDMNALTEKYPNIVGFYPLSCTSKVQKFKDRLVSFRNEMIERLQEVGTHQIYFTDNQFKVLETIREQSPKKAFLSHRQFDDLCQENEIGKTGLSQKDFLGLLDSLGEIIHFPKLIRLNAFVLNPRWLTYGVYTLLYADKASEQQGELSEQDVVNILQNESVKDEHGNILDFPADKCGFIIDAMEEFKLCYRLSNDDSRFVIPDKLQTEQPDLTTHFDKTQPDTLAFEFDFRGFLPRHVMPSLIVTRHEDIVENLVWQNGVVLHNQRHKALARVQVDYHQRVLQLWLQGEGKREFLEILNDEINKILLRMEKLEYDEMVILPQAAHIASLSLPTSFNEEVEKAPYKRLMAEARAGQQVTISDAGVQYDLQQVMGLIMSKKQRDKEGMNVEQHFHGTTHLGAQSFGDKSSASGDVVIKSTKDKKVIAELQQHLTAMMEHVQSHEADFEIKANAYGELKQIREHLENLEEASPETKGKLLQLLEGVKDGSLGAIELGNKIRDASDTLTWLKGAAVPVSALLASVG